MSDVTVFFNPKCGTCRTAWSILEEKGIDAEQYRYLDSGPDRVEIERVMGLLGITDPREMMRAKEAVYQELGLETADRDALIDAMVQHPILIERPIIIRGDRAVIARPADRALELFD